MNNGMAIIEVNDKETKGFFIDQESLEFARQNAITHKHRADREKAEKETERSRRKAEKAAARRKAYTIRTICDIVSRCGIGGAVAWAGAANLIHPVISVPVALFCFCSACLRFGVWLGRGLK